MNRTGKTKHWKNKFGSKHPRSKPVISVCQTSILEHDSLTACSRYLNVSLSNVSEAIDWDWNCRGHKIYYL